MHRRIQSLPLVISSILLALAVLFLGTAGCGPEIADEDLGRVIRGTPPIPEGYEPYELPDLTAAPTEPTDRPDEADGQAVPASEQPAESSEEPAQPVEQPDVPSAPASDPGPNVATAAAASG